MNPDAYVVILGVVWMVTGVAYLVYSWRRLAWALLEMFIFCIACAPFLGGGANSILRALLERSSRTGDYGNFIGWICVAFGIPMIATLILILLFFRQLPSGKYTKTRKTDA